MTESDRDLLRAFVTAGDRDALGELSRRHGDWIAAAARRRLGDPHAAEDVRQAVLLLLLERAADLAARDGPPVAAWLFRATHFTCGRLRRTHDRRRRHETGAGTDRLAERRPAVPDAWAVDGLEDTIAQLPAADREAIVRRFYQRQSYADVGRALGVTDEAARKRVERAVERCRRILTADGVGPMPAIDPEPRRTRPEAATVTRDAAGVRTLARGALTMSEPVSPIRFPVVTTELLVGDVGRNLAFFEHLGFRRWYVEPADAAGHVPRASLRGGAGRVWLRRADAATDPPAASTPGVTVYFWVDGGEPALVAHRNAIAGRGVAVNAFFFDVGLVNFTVTTPDGYRVGFFSTYAPHTFDPASDG